MAWVRVEDDDAAFAYTGTGWGPVSRASASGGQQTESGGTGARSVTFTTPVACTRVRFGLGEQSDGCRVLIEVDGGSGVQSYTPDVNTITNAPSTPFPTAGWQRILWTSAVMPNAAHTVKVSYVSAGGFGSGGNNFPVDFMEYLTPPPGARSMTDRFDALNTFIWTAAGGATVSGGNLVLPIDTAGQLRLRSNTFYDFSAGGVISLHVVDWGDWASHLDAHGYLPRLLISSLASGDNLDPTSPSFPSAPYSAGFQLVMPTSSPPAPFTDEAALVPYHDGTGELTVAEVIDPTNHAYLRMREASGNLYWERSANGTTWVEMTHIAYPADWNLQRVMIRLDEGLPGF